jgi:hypothetical protein
MVRPPSHNPQGPLLSVQQAVTTKNSDFPAADVTAIHNIDHRQNKELGELVWFLPAGLSTAAFLSYDVTRSVVHDFIDVAAGHTWTAADGGK